MYFAKSDTFNDTAEITNCLFFDNSASLGGGAIMAENVSLEIQGCTIADNSADEGEGVWLGATSHSISNSILWSNDDEQIYILRSNSVSVDYSNVDGGENAIGGTGTVVWGTGNLDVDPDFINPATGNYRLDHDSPLLDVGNEADMPLDTFDVNDNSNTSEWTPDEELKLRVTGDEMDMGCYECSCPADFDEDGAVDFDDFTQLLAEFGSTCPCEADLDGDGDVDFDDFTNLLANYGPCPCETDPGLTLLQQFLAAGLDEDDYDDYLDIMENGTQQQKDCWTAWVDHYLNCSPSCAGSEVTECDDPFLTN